MGREDKKSDGSASENISGALVSRIISPCEVAARFRRSRSWFYSHRKRLEQIGFPPKDTELGGWPVRSVDKWLDQREKIHSHSSVEAQALEIIHGLRHV